MLFLPNQAGYDIFTSYIHQNPATGIIHGLGLPIAAAGVMIIIYSILAMVFHRVTAERWSRYVIAFILGGYATGYVTMDFKVGVGVIVFYGWVMGRTITYLNRIKYPYDRKKYLLVGVLMLGIPVIMMEFFGHWYLEGLGSDVSQLFNSIYHTPLYGTRAVLRLIMFFMTRTWCWVQSL